MFLEANVTIYSTDQEQSVKFYNEVLGMRLAFRNVGQWAELTASGLTVGIAPRTTPAAPSTAMSLVFNVASLDSEIKTLTAKGVKFTSEIVDKPTARVIEFHDPDGNSLCLC